MGIVSVALRKVRSVTALSWNEIALIAPVFVLLGVARVMILVLPFRHYGPRFGRQVGLETVAPEVSVQTAARAAAIGRVVRRTAQNTPWQSLCLAQAMVAALLLRVSAVPYCAVFGLAPGPGPGAGADARPANGDPLSAHAWVRVGKVNITGGQDVRRYAVVMVFAHMPASFQGEGT